MHTYYQVLMDARDVPHVVRPLSLIGELVMRKKIDDIDDDGVMVMVVMMMMMIVHCFTEGWDGICYIFK